MDTTHCWKADTDLQGGTATHVHNSWVGSRHVMLPKDIAKLVPKTHLLSESEWRNLGVQQSQGWVHYMIHEPEPHILLFRRPLPKKPEK
ncbi:cyclin-dependent kinases regulatory subunit 1 isoform X2 [Poecile atricapillus]|uniref:cyclin-dependent kinases regulatory subunit 1 isoform X2 n=1 Tax=Poecile atricapillus TaxID=48891 RepID=UPI002738E6C5|nr:cyclin-dependent kinases regulatory subunit 1 isoform X2 [Poecile atricapillus]